MKKNFIIEFIYWLLLAVLFSVLLTILPSSAPILDICLLALAIAFLMVKSLLSKKVKTGVFSVLILIIGYTSILLLLIIPVGFSWFNENNYGYIYLGIIFIGIIKLSLLKFTKE